MRTTPTNRRSRRPKGAALIALALIVLLMPFAPGAPRVHADDPHLVIKMATTGADGSPLIRQMQRLAAIIEQRCAGLIRVKLFPDGRLGDDAKLLGELQSGAIQIYAGEFGAFEQVVPEAAVIASPFLFRDYAGADKALDGSARRRFDDAMREHGMALAAWGPSVFTRWFSRGPAPTSASAFAGLPVLERELRAPDGWDLLEAQPLASLSARAQADRWLLRSTSVRARATGESDDADHVTRSDDVLHGYAIALSQRWFDGLPARLQEALERWPLDPTLEARREARELDEALLERMQKRGKTLTDLPPASRRTFAEIAHKLAAERAKQAGGRANALLHDLTR